ncbi:MAG: YCF48-related protein [Bacteroidia bacterium]|nr:YCF48-related protein [Bacteroidia bacterium]
MCIRISLLLLLSLVFSCKETSLEKSFQIKTPTFDTFPINASVRAIEVVDELNMWFAAGEGMFGYTEDGGNSWTQDSIKIGDKPLEFRAIAITEEAVFLLSTGSPAYLLRSENKGQSWEEVYKEELPGTYYNSLKFWDKMEGIAVGDPTESCLSVIITRDGGKTWKKVSCESLPQAAEGEAGFAASNTNIALRGDHVWLATGGAKARIIHSADKGRSWEVYDTPIIQGGQMTGIFSVDFLDEKNGIIFGGDWEKQDAQQKTKAITNDGGKTWRLVSNGDTPGFRSCVQYVPGSSGKGILAVGSPGISYSMDAGESWVNLNDEGFYTIRIADSGKAAWLAGKNRIMKMSW